MFMQKRKLLSCKNFSADLEPFNDLVTQGKSCYIRRGNFLVDWYDISPKGRKRLQIMYVM